MTQPWEPISQSEMDELDRAYEYAYEEALRKAELARDDEGYPGGYDLNSPIG